MSTLAIDATNPSTTVNLADLLACIDRLLEAARRNQPYLLKGEDYQLLNEIRFAVTTGVPSANTVTAVTMTY